MVLIRFFFTNIYYDFSLLSFPLTNQHDLNADAVLPRAVTPARWAAWSLVFKAQKLNIVADLWSPRCYNRLQLSPHRVAEDIFTITLYTIQTIFLVDFKTFSIESHQSQLLDNQSDRASPLLRKPTPRSRCR